jgi:hypothetical protein
MERAMLTALAVCVGGLELVLRELVLPVLALAMASTGMRWEGCGSGAWEAAGCCAPAIPSRGQVGMRAPAAAQEGALVLGMGLRTTRPKGANGWSRHAGGSPTRLEEERAAVGQLGQKTVRELRELARLCGMRELARKGRKADLLEALEA